MKHVSYVFQSEYQIAPACYVTKLRVPQSLRLIEGQGESYTNARLKYVMIENPVICINCLIYLFYFKIFSYY